MNESSPAFFDSDWIEQFFVEGDGLLHYGTNERHDLAKC